MTLGNLDSNGIGRYDETTPIGTTWSAFMNLALATVSAALTALFKLRYTQTGSDDVPASASGSNKTVAVTFDAAYASAPEVVCGKWLAGSGTIFLAFPESVTTTGFTMRVVNTAGTSWSGTVGPFTWIAVGTKA